MVQVIDFSTDFIMAVVCKMHDIFFLTDMECSLNIDRAVQSDRRMMHVMICPKKRSELDDDYINESVDFFYIYSNERGRQKEVLKQMEGWLTKWKTGE